MCIFSRFPLINLFSLRKFSFDFRHFVSMFLVSSLLFVVFSVLFLLLFVVVACFGSSHHMLTRFRFVFWPFICLFVFYLLFFSFVATAGTFLSSLILCFFLN